MMATSPTGSSACHRRRRTLPPEVWLYTTLLTALLFLNDTVLAQKVIDSLPGFPGKLPFRLETGYVGVGEKEDVQLFYYFVESDGNPKEDPLILWMTGGPGCSSISGFIYRIGPLSIDAENSEGTIPTLILNEYAWTKMANIIFLDQPAGTGFSYSKTAEGSYSNDTLSSKMVQDFIKKWLTIHPKYIENPFYVGGDSYAGIFVPLVVNEVYNGIKAGTTPEVNIKGYILGNPRTDGFIDLNGKYSYAHRMGLLSDELYQSARVHCHGNYVNVDPKNSLCLKDLERMKECLEYINAAQILEPSCEKKTDDILSWHSFPHQNPTRNLHTLITQNKYMCRKMSYSLCHSWANNKSVQKALYIREGTIEEWVRCNKSIQNNIPSPYGNLPYVKDVHSTVPFHRILTKNICRALIYSGDHDMGIPHTTTKEWIDSLELSVQSLWRPWFVDGQVAGYTVGYAKKDYELTFATVKGAGHTGPEYKPSECFAMITRWFDQAPL